MDLVLRFFFSSLCRSPVYEPAFSFSFIAGLNGHLTARRFCRLRREFPLSRQKKIIISKKSVLTVAIGPAVSRILCLRERAYLNGLSATSL